MNCHLSAEFCRVLNAIWVAPVTAKLSSKTVISKKQKKHWKRNKSNSSDMASETDQNSQRLLRKTKLIFFLSWQKVAWITFTTLALLNTVGLNNMIHFSLRGRKEQQELRWVDIALKTESDGKEYLEHFERQKRLERERIHGINGRSSRECMPTTMPFLSNGSWSSARLQDVQRKRPPAGAGNGLWTCRFSAFHDRPS